MPEGAKFDDAKMGEYTKTLGEFEATTKADHAEMQKFGQRLVDMYVAEAKETAQRMQTAQVDNWNRVRETWKEEFRADPEIGGNRQDTTIRHCGAVLEAYGAHAGTEREAALRLAMRVTGAGDNPEMIRFINWAADYTTEKARPVAANVPKAPLGNSKAKARYRGSLPSNGVS